jgi:alkylation response protein AidB-like acyl-CoA dehydrogenase
MDFGLSEEQGDLRDLAKQILGDHTGAAALKAADGPGIHRDLWAALGEAGLLGVGLAEHVGGLGMGDFTDICLLLEQVGRHVAPVPALESIVFGALPLAEFGTPAQREEADLAGVIAGRTVLTGAFLDTGADDPMRPGTRAESDGEGWRLFGIKTAVPSLHLAHRVLVPATLPSGSVATFLVDPTADGATVEVGTGTHDLPVGSLALDGVRVSVSDVIGHGRGDEVVRWIVQRAQIGLCAMALGLAGKALHLTASYVTGRHQFGVPLATFQAVSQRAGDAWIDVESIRLVVQRASWLLAAGREAGKEVAVARIITSDAAHRVACSAIHLHGGIGFDRDYPLYRYFLWTKHLEFLLGPAVAQVAQLGDRLAADARVCV